jgi:hypothetical protein
VVPGCAEGIVRVLEEKRRDSGMSQQWDLLVNSCVVVAELIVARVIYLEVRHSRAANFLEKATKDEANQDRREIYNEFLKIPGDLETKSTAFSDMIVKPENRCLKHKCERQIALFNDLGFSSRKPILAFLGREDPLVALLPHACICIWVIVKPYILRRRADTGPAVVSVVAEGGGSLE